MKLKCDKHGRRVLSSETGFLHRTGDMSRCDSKTAVIGDRKYAFRGGTFIQTHGDMKVDLTRR